MRELTTKYTQMKAGAVMTGHALNAITIENRRIHVQVNNTW